MDVLRPSPGPLSGFYNYHCHIESERCQPLFSPNPRPRHDPPPTAPSAPARDHAPARSREAPPLPVDGGRSARFGSEAHAIAAPTGPSAAPPPLTRTRQPGGTPCPDRDRSAVALAPDRRQPARDPRREARRLPHADQRRGGSRTGSGPVLSPLGARPPAPARSRSASNPPSATGAGRAAVLMARLDVLSRLSAPIGVRSGGACRSTGPCSSPRSPRPRLSAAAGSRADPLRDPRPAPAPRPAVPAPRRARERGKARAPACRRFQIFRIELGGNGARDPLRLSEGDGLAAAGDPALSAGQISATAPGAHPQCAWVRVLAYCRQSRESWRLGLQAGSLTQYNSSARGGSSYPPRSE